MRRVLPLLLLLSACSHNGDENLGLTEGKKVSIDVEALTRPEELVRALSLHGRTLDERLGAHRMDAKQTLELTLPGEEKQTLDETFVVQSDGHGTVHVVHDNQRYGFEAFAAGKDLFVKPRYGKFVRERLEGDALERLRRAAETTAAADLRLLERFVQVREAGTAEVAGHAAVKLALSARTTPAPASPERETGRKWRETLAVRYIDGSVTVDAKSGAPLAVRLEAAYTFQRDGKPLAATIKYQQTTSADPGALVAPTDYAELGHARPMLDRQTLLDGLR